MQPRGVSRYLPLLVSLALLAALAAVYAPGVIRAWRFRATVNSLLADVRSGDLGKVPGYVLPEQQPALSDFVQRSDVVSYASAIATLKLSHYYREEDHVWATVTAKAEGNRGMAHANLRWIWNGKDWQLDALNSHVGIGPPAAQSRGMRIGEMAERAPGAILEAFE